MCWRAVCAEAKLGSLRLHDLRHTAASQAVMSGENLSLVGKLLGHRRHRTTAGYAHLADGHLVEAAEAIGAVVSRAMRMSIARKNAARTAMPHSLPNADDREYWHNESADA